MHYSIKNIGRVIVLNLCTFIFVPNFAELELRYLISAHRLIMLFVCSKLCEIFERVSELLSGHDFHIKFFKRAYFRIKM